MKKKTSIKEIKIGFRCSEDWSEMIDSNEGKHCQKCDKVVTDFTKLSNRKIITLLEKNRNEKICGRFEENQIIDLNKFLSQPKQSNQTKYLAHILASAVFTTVSCSSSKELKHQNCDGYKPQIEILKENTNPDSFSTTKFSGIVVDENNQPLINASVLIEGSVYGAATDSSGQFSFELDSNYIPDKPHLLSQYLGFLTHKSKVEISKNKKVKIIMKEESLTIDGIIFIPPKQPFHKRMWNRFTNLFK